MNHYEAKGIEAVLPGLELVLQSIESEVNRMLDLVNGQGSENPAMRPEEHQRKRLSMAGARTWHNMSAAKKRARLAAMKRGRLSKAKMEARTS